MIIEKQRRILSKQISDKIYYSSAKGLARWIETGLEINWQTEGLYVAQLVLEKIINERTQISIHCLAKNQWRVRIILDEDEFVIEGLLQDSLFEAIIRTLSLWEES